MKSEDSRVKGPAAKGSLVKCKRSKSTSSDGEVVVHSSTHTNQQLRPDSHPPHSSVSNEVSTVRFEQIEPSCGPSNSGSTSTSGAFYTPNHKLITGSSVHGTSSTTAAGVVATATSSPNSTTIIASAIPHRTRHSSLNSTLSRFSLRRLLTSFSESNQTSPVSSASPSSGNTAVTLSTGPAGKVGGKNTISVDSVNHKTFTGDTSVNSKSNNRGNRSLFQITDTSSPCSSSQGCAKYSMISTSNDGEGASAGTTANSPAPPLSASSISFHGSALRNSSRSLQHSIIPINNLRKQHAAIKTSSFSGNQGATGHGASSTSTSNGDDGTHECPLCLLELPLDCYPKLRTCSHRACFDCLQQYLKIEISESRVMVTCPECTELIHPNDIRTILNDELYTEKYERFMLRRVLIAEADARWCPAPDCGYVVVATGCAGCPKLQCERPGCFTEFCYHCKQIWHPNQTCDAARAQRFNINGDILITTPSGANASNGDAIIVVDGIVTSRHAKDSDIKNCPHCRVLIIKMDDGSCNHMTCSVCGTEFCWLCMKRITDLHYLSPSGCTFWGKKPWSRKKKILWQLGMLVGAPVGIALLAGIAVPAIIIGIPVWVGRKLHARFQKRESMSQKNKHIMLATGVIASVCVSPILALVAVGIGIPILLAYVYGVVPISLCRSGGCNVNTSTSGVRIDMNEESEETSGEKNSTRGAADGLSVDTAVSNKVNPSIGEVSLGMSASLSMGSGSHLDRVTVDRESVSNVPLTGSIYSATASNKLEVTVDVSSNKRFSFSSHSESASCGISLSERVSNSGALDDGTSSTLGLAGSITGHT